MNKTINFLTGLIGQHTTLSPSPLMRWLNPVIRHVELGEVQLQFSIREEMCNPAGALHGGVSSAIIDDTIGMAIYTYDENQFYPTINLSVDFFSSVNAGDEVMATARILKKGNRLVNAVCEIHDLRKDRIVARGTSNLIKTETK